MINVARDESPVFIIGSPRSGTTMLRLMVTCHPNICIPPEGGFAIALKPIYGDLRVFPKDTLEQFIGDFFATDKQAEWGLTWKDLQDALFDADISAYPQLVAAVYRAYMRVRESGKKRWGDKNNFYLNHIITLASMFPKAQFLHIVRDGRDILCSYIDVSGLPEMSSLPTDPVRAALRWYFDLLTIQNAVKSLQPKSYMELRYEDLVRDPGLVLREVCEFLGECFSPSMLDFAERTRREKLEPDRYMPWKKLVAEPITTSRVGRWRQELSQRDVAVFEAVADRWLSAYGYSLSRYQMPLVLRVWLKCRVCWLKLAASRSLRRKRFWCWAKRVHRWRGDSARSASVAS